MLLVKKAKELQKEKNPRNSNEKLSILELPMKEYIEVITFQ